MSNLLKRLLTAAVGVPILLWLIFFGPKWVFTLFAAGIALICSREYYNIVSRDSRRMTILGPLLCTSTVLALGFFSEDIRVWATVATLIPLASLLILLVRPGEMREVPSRAGMLALGLLYTGFLPALVALLHLPDNGPAYLILLLSVAFLGDTGAYTSGRIFGRHPLYPSVSPKKTWEGALGGLLASAASAAVAHYWYLPDFPLVIGLILGVFLGALGQMGDLCESMLKRAYDVKDSGRILPGHGGMLDRVDGVLFVAAGLYLARLWIPSLP